MSEEPIWNKFLTERDKQVFEISGYGARGGFGKRPALLVIDVNYAFCGDKPEPILESIKTMAQFLRRESVPGVPSIKSLDRQVPRQGPPGDLHHRHPPRRQLGFGLVGLEEQPRRRSPEGRRHQRRRQSHRRRDRARPARTS